MPTLTKETVLNNLAIIIEMDKERNLDSLRLIETNTGSPPNCMLSLGGYAGAQAMVAWYIHHDLAALKREFSTITKCEAMALQLKRDMGNAFLTAAGWMPGLVCDNELLLQWMCENAMTFDGKYEKAHKAHWYLFYQWRLAVLGDFEQLAKNCERVLADPPKGSQVKKYVIDYEFLRALARKDVPEMERTLTAILQPRSVRGRTDDGGYHTNQFVCSSAVVLAKIARRHGFELKVESPWLPSEWLPVAPLAEYPDPYDFLKKFDPSRASAKLHNT